MSDTPVKRGRGRPKTPQPPTIARLWEYMTLSSEQPLKVSDFNIFGVDGWELVSVYVRMDAVHAVFKREMV